MAMEVVGNKKETSRKGAGNFYLPKLVCFHPVDAGPRFDRGVPEIDRETGPTHLVVMVNGIIGRLIARHL